MYQVYKNVFSLEDINQLLEYFNKDDGTADVRPDCTTKTPAWDSLIWPIQLLEQKLTPLLGTGWSVEMSIFAASKLSFRVHTDSGTHETNSKIYKNVLIPLAFDGEAGTVLFNNYYTDTEAVFSRGNISPFRYSLLARDGNFTWVDDIRTLLAQCKETPEVITEFDVTDQFILDLENLIQRRNTGYSARINDYTLISGFDPVTQFDEQVQQRYLKHIPLEDLHGLSIDGIVNWEIGDAIVFDRTQLHSATSTHLCKIGLSLFTIKD